MKIQLPRCEWVRYYDYQGDPDQCEDDSIGMFAGQWLCKSHAFQMDNGD